MAANAFTVEPAALKELMNQLFVLSNKLGEARAVTQGIDAGGFGSDRLTKATHDFVGHWKWQADRLVQTLEDTAGRLGQAAAQYEQVEQTQLRAQGQG